MAKNLVTETKTELDFPNSEENYENIIKICDKPAIYLNAQEKMKLLSYVLLFAKNVQNKTIISYGIQILVNEERSEEFNLFLIAVSKLTGSQVHSSFLKRENLWKVSI